MPERSCRNRGQRNSSHLTHGRTRARDASCYNVCSTSHRNSVRLFALSKHEIDMGALLMIANLLRLTGYVTEPLLDSHEVHAVVGEPERIPRTPPPGRGITVVSWNIAQGAHFERVRAALADLDADIYLLQEVDLGVKRSGYRNVARDLADALGMNWVFAGEFQEIGQSRRSVPAITGQAVLSRYPIRNASALPFENQARLRWRLDPLQPRRGGRMALRAESGGMLLYNAHIESAKNDRFRRKQVAEVMYDHLLSARETMPVVFAGDFNTGMQPDSSPVIRTLMAEGFVDALGDATTLRPTSIHHEQPLDWIFVRNIASRRGRVVEVPAASDHYPLEALVSFGTTPRLAE
jgi:endonuclease/exonuclease/phosphatase family metal-dependent hydrolase